MQVRISDWIRSRDVCNEGRKRFHCQVGWNHIAFGITFETWGVRVKLGLWHWCHHWKT